MWKKYWNTLITRVGSYTNGEKQKLYALFSVLGFSVALLVESLLFPYYGARTAISFILCLTIALLFCLPLLAGFMMAWLFDQKNTNPKRESVKNMLAFIVLSVIVGVITQSLQHLLIENMGVMGWAMRSLLSSIDESWILLINVGIIWLTTALKLREDPDW